MAGLTEAQKRDAIIRTVIGEAANQGEAGMQAVAAVIANRANSGQFGTTDPYRIATQPYQFSANNSVSNGGNNVGRNASENSRIYREAAAAVDGVLNGTIPDPTGGATYYHTADTTAPWDRNMAQTAQIGAHVFYSPSGHPVPPANIPNALALPTGIDLSAYNGGSGNSALNAIGSATTPGPFANAPGQVGQAPPVPLAPPVGSVQSTFNRLGMMPPPSDALAAYVNAKAASMAPNASSSPNDRMSANQQTMQNLGAPMTSADASGFYSGFPLGSPSLSPMQIAGVGNGAALPSSGASGSGSINLPPPLPMIANIGAAASPSTFPARPGVVAPNGSAPYGFNYGAPANPVSVPPYTPGKSVADINLNDALYPNGQPTYKSTGALPDIPKWAMPSVPVTVIPPGRGNTIVNGAVNGAIRSAAPDIAAALGPVFGGARSLVDNLPPMIPQTPPSVASSFPARPTYSSPNNTGGSSSNYGTPGYSGNSSYSPSSYSAPAPTPYESSGWNFGGSSVPMNDPSGAGNTYSQPKTITQQVLNPAWSQWQAQTSPGDSQFAGTDTGYSWAGLNTGDASNPFSSFASPANIPSMPAPPKYIPKVVANPNYVNPQYEPPLAYPTAGNPFASAFNRTHIGGLLSLLNGGQNASDMLFGGGSTGVNRVPQIVPSLLSLGLTPQQRSVSTPAYIAAVNAGQSGYTPAGSNTWMPTTTTSGGFRQSYGDSSSSGSLASRG